MSVTLLEVWRAARARAVPFSGESAGFLALALCEEVQGAPRHLELRDVALAADGSVRVVSGGAVDAARVEVELRALLARLLEVASSPGPALFRAAGRAEPRGLAALDVELRQALIPFNRAAARRALLRLYRETERAVANQQLGALPDQGDSSTLLRVSPPPPPARERTPAPAVSEPSPSPSTASPLPAVLLELAAGDLTRPESVVGFVKHGRPTPPPLPRVPAGAPPARPEPAPTVTARTREPAAPGNEPTTPRIGSVDDVVVVPPSPVLSALPDLTERAPEVFELLTDGGPVPLPVTPLLDLAVRPIIALTNAAKPAADAQIEEEQPSAARLPPVQPATVSGAATPLPAAADAAGEVVTPLPAIASGPTSADEEEAASAAITLFPPAVPLAELEELTAADIEEESALEESPVLVVGVQVHDSEEVAAAVTDDELETRPLRSALPAAPYAGAPPRPTHVNELLQQFQVAGALDEQDLRNELKALAGVEGTPGFALGVRSR